MNIDTSTHTANSDKSNYLSAMQASRALGNNAFKSQFQKISSDDTAKNDETKSDVNIEEKVSDKKSEDNSKDEDKKVETKVDDKTKKTENKQENNVKNEGDKQNQQNPQQNGQNGQNPQNQQLSKLSDEINAILKINSNIGGFSSLQNTQFVTGISEDVYTSAPTINYNQISMSDEDAMFFANLITKTDMSMQSIAGEFQKTIDAGDVQNVKKTAKVSSVLMDALADSMKSNKAFRIDFDKDISVVMRVDKNGNLNANFIPGDKAVEAYLKNNISYLKQRFDEQNLPYSELTYNKHKQQGQNEEKRNNKENNHE